MCGLRFHTTGSRRAGASTGQSFPYDFSHGKWLCELHYYFSDWREQGKSHSFQLGCLASSFSGQLLLFVLAHLSSVKEEPTLVGKGNNSNNGQWVTSLYPLVGNAGGGGAKRCCSPRCLFWLLNTGDLIKRTKLGMITNSILTKFQCGIWFAVFFFKKNKFKSEHINTSIPWFSS